MHLALRRSKTRCPDFEIDSLYRDIWAALPYLPAEPLYSFTRLIQHRLVRIINERSNLISS